MNHLQEEDELLKSKRERDISVKEGFHTTIIFFSSSLASRDAMMIKKCEKGKKNVSTFDFSRFAFELQFTKSEKKNSLKNALRDDETDH